MNNKKIFSQINTSGLDKKFLPENTGSYIMNYDLTKNRLSISNENNNIINNPNILNFANSATNIIFDFFSPINALCSKPKFTVTSNSIIIHIFYYIRSPNRSLNNNTINNLGEILSKLSNKNIELRMVKINYPYLDRHILAQYIALNTQDFTFLQIIRRIFRTISPVANIGQSKDKLPNLLTRGITGIKIQLSGRLVTERSKPRQTVQTANVGTFSKSNKSMIDRSSYTTKNKKNSFTIKVWINNNLTL